MRKELFHLWVRVRWTRTRCELLNKDSLLDTVCITTYWRFWYSIIFRNTEENNKNEKTFFVPRRMYRRPLFSPSSLDGLWKENKTFLWRTNKSEQNLLLPTVQYSCEFFGTLLQRHNSLTPEVGRRYTRSVEN